MLSITFATLIGKKIVFRVVNYLTRIQNTRVKDLLTARTVLCCEGGDRADHRRSAKSLFLFRNERKTFPHKNMDKQDSAGGT